VTLAALGAGVATALRGRDTRDELRARIRLSYGSSEVVLTDSGTTALALAIRASAPAGTPPRVALPAYGCFDLMTAADAAQAEVVLYDLDPETLAPDRESLRAALAHGPHAVVVAHWYGVPVELDAIAVEVAGAGAVLIEDAAQGVGATLRGRPLGSYGDLAVLSFGRGKGRTGGRGGALLVNDLRCAPAVLLQADRVLPPSGGAADLVMLGALWALGRPSLFWLPAMLPGLHLGETVYRPPGQPAGLPHAAAAVILAIWDLAELEAGVRRANVVRWLHALRGTTDLVPVTAPAAAQSGWLRLPVCVRGVARAALLGDAARVHGVMPGYPRTLAHLSRPIRNPTASRTGAEDLVATCLTLPTHRQLADRDVTSIRGLLR
jgi:dTDP-4-amino-4,6-dideoxygalactose transaminase